MLLQLQENGEQEKQVCKCVKKKKIKKNVKFIHISVQ